MDNVTLPSGFAQYGPRVMRGDGESVHIELPAAGEEPQFFGVYVRAGDQWVWFADARDEVSARAIAQSLEERELARVRWSGTGRPASWITSLDVAYLAIGAQDALKLAPREQLSALKIPQLDLIQQVIGYAGMLAELWDAIPDGEYGGVFAYEVAEPLGFWIVARRLIGHVVSDAEVREKARELIES